MEYWEFWGVVVVQAVICGILSGTIAEAKGHSNWKWQLVGLFFGLFGLIAAAGLPDLYARPPQATTPPPAATRKRQQQFARSCPTCAEPVRIAAKVCGHCGYKFTHDELLEAVRQAVRDSRPDIQAAGFELIEGLDRPQIVPELIEMVGDVRHVARSKVIEALGRLKVTEAAPTILAALVANSRLHRDGGQAGSREFRMAAIHALLELGDASTVEEILQRLDEARDDHPTLLEDLVRMAARLGGARVVVQLVDAANSGLVASEIVGQEISRIGPDAIEPLRQLVTSATQGQRRWIEQLIERIENDHRA